MNNEEILRKLEESMQKIDEMYKSIEKLKTYIKWIIIISIILFVLPLIGLMFAIPSYLNTLNTITSF